MKREILAAALVAVAAAVPRIWLLSSTSGAGLFADMIDYHDRARYLIEHGRLYPDAFRVPGYPLAIAAAFTIFGPGLGGIRILQCLILTLTAVATFALARGAMPRHRAIGAGLIVAWYPGLLLYTVYVMAEPLYTLLLLLAVLCARGARRGIATFAAGLFGGLATMTRQAGVAVVVALATWVARSRWPRRDQRVGDLVSRNSDSSHNSRAGHPGWLRCFSLKYAQYSRSSRLAIPTPPRKVRAAGAPVRAPRSGTYATNHCSGTLAPAPERALGTSQSTAQLALGGRHGALGRIGGRFMLVASLLAGTAVAIAPWAWRNHEVFGRWTALETTGGITFLMANYEDATGRYLLSDWETVHQRYLRDEPEEFTRNATAYRLGLRKIAAEPGRILGLVPRRLGYLFDLEGREHLWLYTSGYFGPRSGRIIMAFGVALLVSFPALVSAALVSIFFGPRAQTNTEALLLWMLGVMLVQLLTVFGDPRFHLPLIPLFAVLAMRPWPRVERPSLWRRGAGALALVAALAWWATRLPNQLQLLDAASATNGWQLALPY